jgi:hypothetical protein
VRIPKGGAGANGKRAKIREEFWPTVPYWRGPAETGFFCAPRSLPLVLRALRQKSLSGSKDPSSVYLDLLANHWSEGIVELSHAEDHAYAAGYANVRIWQDRMKILEDTGFIKSAPRGNRRYGTILIVHPSVVMKQLKDEGKIPDDLWKTYRDIQIRSKEVSESEINSRDTD